eukprot:522654-Prymnesium_polylepis.2
MRPVMTEIAHQRDCGRRIATGTPFCCTAGADGSAMGALTQLIKSYAKERRELHPELYLKASGEGLGLCILLSTIITAIFKPEQFESNASIDYLGYNNPCVPWDVAPALYIACIIFSFLVYLNIRFAVTMSQRTLLQDPPHPHRKKIVTVYWMWALSFAIIMLIFVVTPRGRQLAGLLPHDRLRPASSDALLCRCGRVL